MSRRPARTLVAVVLTAAAVALPCLAWYVAGSREAQRQARFMTEAPRTAASRTAIRLADHLGVRLAALREVESRRPFFHYQSQFHDPLSDCECASITPSPLSNGPSDPLVWAYFQVDVDGGLTLPNFGERIHSESGGLWLSDQAKILESLTPTVSECSVAMEVKPPPPSRSEILSMLGVDESALQIGPYRKETLELMAWVYNMELSGIQCDKATVIDAVDAFHLEQGTHAPSGKVVVEVGPFRWRTVTVAGDPSLFALRDVSTPTGRFFQGFVISNEYVREIVGNETFPAQWSPGSPKTYQAALVPVPGTLWHVGVDASFAEDHAASSSRQILNRFRRTFTVGSLFAVLAGFGLVSLVWQTDRLARQRSRFAASAAHELRTPLAGMRMYSEMLADDLGDPSKTRRYAGQIAREADRLGRVVSNVMSYTRLERGQVHLNREPGDLGATVSQALESLRPAMELAEAELELTVAPDVPQVSFDRDAVEQIVQNLVDNAEKYSRGAENRTIHVSVGAQKGAAVISVTDHGPGVPPACRSRVFRPFARGLDTDAPAGLGLGLTLVRALVAAHGGSVECSDAPGGGGLFRLTLPV